MLFRSDDLSERLEDCARQRVQRHRAAQTTLERRLLLRDPKAVLARTRLKLAPLEAKLQSSMLARLRRERQESAALHADLVQSTRERLQERRERLALRATQLDGLSPLRILGRGYAIATKDGRIVKRAAEVAPGDELEVRLGAGSVRSKVTQVREGQDP